MLTFTLGIFTAVALNTFFNIIDPGRNYYFISQFADRVAYYAFGLASQLTLLYIFLYGFRHSFNKRYALMDELNRNSYSVYIIHTIVLRGSCAVDYGTANSIDGKISYGYIA